ncbi:DUF1304 domain-containing protein [Hamadaea tsunoensis]|uniref:DUF1304 domain-containing protein n=1 Tax=Hamadaea tsunoensis TaxID=53368 RepID=UPI0003FB8234|nr:DUF1304 domain-containing protein [Hamadaea tsunoensis]
MNLVAQLFAVIAGLIHVLIFAMEALLFTRPEVYRRFRADPHDVPAIRPWAFNQGFYNLFLAVGALAGVLVVHTGDRTAGRTLVGFACLCMLGAALVLAGSDRRMLRSALIQGVAPLITVVFLVL